MRFTWSCPSTPKRAFESADLSDLQPAEYRADLVVLLSDGTPVLGIVVEVQLAVDRGKLFAWPMYVVGLRARIKCPVHLLVVAPNDRVAEWAAEPILLGGDNRFSAMVLRSAGVPIVIDAEQAKRDPELAVLSAMTHGRDADPDRALQVALVAMMASAGLDADRSVLYYDLVYASLSETARKTLQAMDPAKYELQSEFAKRYLAQGRAEGRAEGEAKGEIKGEIKGEAKVLLKLLALKFGPLPQGVAERVQTASIEQLDRWAERVLSATSLEQVLGQ